MAWYRANVCDIITSKAAGWQITDRWYGNGGNLSHCVWYSVGLIQCHPVWIGIGVRKCLTQHYFLRVHVSYLILLACYFVIYVNFSLAKDGS